MIRNRATVRGLLVCAALLSVPVFLVAALNTIGCCAIDPEKFPEKVAENRRRQSIAAVVALGAVAVGGASLVGVVMLRPRRG